uniref:TACI cysteine-rich domain-containing protein n=1 Tax=Poecilia latipinna TaxID=48699 RepID=A0A3B3TIF9_9TELE
MGKGCKEGEHPDSLTRSCVPCRILCRKLPTSPSCAVYCEAALCRAKPGHYYDRLVRRCMKCADICGKHPAECSPHCPTQSALTVTIRLPTEVSKQAVNTKPPLGPLDPVIQSYALLGLCAILLLSSLCLALVVFLRRGKAKNSNTKPTSTKNQKQTSAVQPGQESGFPENCPSSSTYPLYRESSEDSYPTETCVCVHCFPDLRGLSQDNLTVQLSQSSVTPRKRAEDGESMRCPVSGSVPEKHKK